METDQLKDEAIANPKPNLAPEEIGSLENDPARIAPVLDEQTAKDEPELEEQQSVANDAGEDEPIVRTKNGKGIIPYEKHKALRVENSALREQLQAARLENREAVEKLEALMKQKDEAQGMDGGVTDEALARHLETLKKDMPEVHQVITAVFEGSRKQGEKLEKTLDELRREREESARARQLTVEEQVAEAKDNNPDLVHWETTDPEAWEEALRQDEILRTTSAWAGRPYAERFEEVVRRVRALIPEAPSPMKKEKPDPEQTKAHAKARLDAATARKPITLSDIQGGANPASEREQMENLSPHELAKRLLQMPSHKAAALRAELD